MATRVPVLIQLSDPRDAAQLVVYYVTMQITFPIPEFARKERNLHCDVVQLFVIYFIDVHYNHAVLF